MRPLLSLIVLIWVGFVQAQSSPVTDEEIKPIYFEPMNYPLVARIKHIQGVVVLLAKLDRTGNVTATEAVSGAEALIQDCLTNAKKWRFQPNPHGNVVIIYEFRIEGLCHAPCLSQFSFKPPNEATIRIGEQVVDHD